MNTESKANAAFTSIMLRGGRVTKWKGQVASCAPQVGHLQNVSVAAMAAALAFGGAMAIPSDALAQDVTVVVNSPSPAPEIVAVNSGDGALIINASVPVEGAVTGIFAENESTATNLFITATDVQGGKDGIFADNAGTGATIVKTTGNVVGLAGEGSGGIEVNNRAFAGAFVRDEALTVEANNVTGASFGISAVNLGAGSTRVTTSGDVTGTGNIGIGVSNRGFSNNVVVEANGNVTGGGDDGINAENLGSGSTSVKVTGVVNGGDDGIDALNGPGTSDLTIDANTVTGANEGIDAQNQGSGVTSVTTSGVVTGGNTGISVSTSGTGTTIIKATGDVVGTADIGIDVSNGSAAGVGATGDALTVEVFKVSGRTYGILATNNGAGSTSITAKGDVTGTGYDGIRVINEVLANNLTIKAYGDVSGGNYGIFIQNKGAGSTSITATGDVEGTDSYGIDATNFELANNLTIVANGIVKGGKGGIEADNKGRGSTSITATGDVNGETADGINVRNRESANDLTIVANGVVTGGGEGISVGNSGRGSTSVTATGDVIGKTGDGIDAYNGGLANNLTIVANGTVTGDNNGIEADNLGAGSTSITITGDVIGKTIDGINATNGDLANNLTIETNGLVTATGGVGIFTNNDGVGSTSITAKGDVNGGEDGINAVNEASAGDMTIAANKVKGGGFGIFAINHGAGSTSITATGDVYGTTFDGISAYNAELANDLTIVAGGIVYGGFTGIDTVNYGTGSTSITATGDVTGTAGNGISAANGELANDLTIVANVTVTGGFTGIDAYNQGTGSTNITATGDVTGTAGNGINAENKTSSGDLTIVANDIVTGVARKVTGEYGIRAQNAGQGSTSITASSNVYGTEYDGIYASNGELANDLTIVTNGIVTGGDEGIYAQNNGTGSTSITATGDVTGTDGDGIYAYNGELATDLTIVTKGIVTGGIDGIEVDNDGTGSTTITAEGDVTGIEGDGIDVSNGELANNLTIVAKGKVTGDDEGFAVYNDGTGSTSITAEGNVTGAEGDGILASNGELANDLTIVANGIVTGDNDGIDADNKGTGSTSITATGNVTGADLYGIRASNGELATDLTIVANGIVTGERNGIDANNNGTGSTSITATGDVKSGGGNGIYAENGSYSVDLTIEANNVTGGFNGISVNSNGTGSTSITATGDVTGGTNGNGINATNRELATDLTIVANGIVTGGVYGIDADNNGTGSTSITAEGDVTGKTRAGINAFNDESATDLTIVANGIVKGDNDGIDARNNGTGSTSITATGDVTGTNDDGIRAFNDKLANNVIILTYGTVTGDDSGIDVSNVGTGSTSITTTGYVSGGEYGIRADIEYGVGDLTIDAGKVTGGNYGIEVRNQGAGSTRVTTSGDVTGTSEDGIRVLNFVNDIIVVANGNVKGGENGIETINLGLGSTSITATGDVDGQSVNGIDVRNSATATDILVVANKVTGAIDGINALIEGNGLVDVTINGLVFGGVQGIDLLNLTTSVDLNASVDVSDTGSVTGAVNGINMVNIGTGATKLTSSGKVSGGTYGISVANTATGTDVTVSGGDVTGGVNGLDVSNLGTGNTIVTGTGTVTGTTGNGIDVFNAATAGSMTIAANNVIGAVNGINAQNEGNGVIDVTVTGAVTGGVYGVNASKGASTGDLTVSVNVANTGSVDGAVYGINLVNVTGGSTTLTSSGKVNGDLIGVFAVNGPDAVDLTVTAGNVTGGVYGLAAVNTGTGDTSVTVSNYASGGTKDGVRVSNVATSGDISITAHDVKGGINAIVATNLGTGATAITASGLVEGGTGVAILASNLAGTTATINITATADVEAASGNAILNDAGNSILNVADGATISGTIRLGDGSDTANLALASSAGFANITVLDGGDNLSAADGFVDRLNFNGAGTYELDSARLTNWEEINVNAGRVTFSNAAITTGTLGINQGGTLNGSNNLLVTGNVIIATGGSLLAGNANGNAATRIVGNLTNGGLVDLSGATAKVGDTLNINGNFTGAGGQIRLDTVVNGDNSPTDFVLVTGNVGGTNQIAINNVGGVGGATVGDGIKLVQVNGRSTADAFALAADLQVGGFRYDVFLGGVADPNDQDWYLRTIGLSDIAATTLSLARLSDDISMTFLGTLHERVGEQEHLAKRGYQNGGVSGLWGRFIGKGFRERLASKDLGEVKSNGSITGMQLGLDLVRKINGNGSATFAGAYSGYADGSSSDTNIFQNVARRSGGSKSKGWLAGLYGTHYGASGWYANAAVQASFLDAAANAANGTTLRTDARTLLGSLEMGKSLKLGGRMAFEPQLQVIYSNNKFDGAVDSTGTLNEVAIEDSIIGRAGFRLKTTKDEKYNADGGLFSGYLKANLWHSFLGTDIGLTSAGQAVGKFEPKKTWVDVGVGTTLTVAKQTEIFFDADVEFGIDQKTTAGTGKIGLRFNW